MNLPAWRCLPWQWPPPRESALLRRWGDESQWRYFAVYLLLGMAALFIATHATHAVPVAKPLEEIRRNSARGE